MLHKTLIAFAAAATLSCLPMATAALAANHGHATAGSARGSYVARSGGGRYYGGGHVARYYGGGYYGGGPIYDSCGGYGYGYGYGPAYGYGCRGYGVPLVGGVINGVLGGYGPY